VFDSEGGQVSDAEETGREELTCRGCGEVYGRATEIGTAAEAAWTRYLAGAQE